MRSVKHGRRKTRRRINYSKNSAVAKKKAVKKRKAMEGISCKQIRLAWDKKATIKQNMEAMGLAYDPNKLFSLRPSISTEHDEMEIDEAKKFGPVKLQKEILKNKSTKKGLSKAAKVIASLEKAAKEEEEQQKRGRRYRLLAQDIEFCVYMIENHGDDYEEMSRDAKNIYQDTPKQIQRKIRIFKQSPEYPKYLSLKSQLQ